MPQLQHWAHTGSGSSPLTIGTSVLQAQTPEELQPLLWTFCLLVWPPCARQSCGTRPVQAPDASPASPSASRSGDRQPPSSPPKLCAAAIETRASTDRHEAPHISIHRPARYGRNAPTSPDFFCFWSAWHMPLGLILCFLPPLPFALDTAVATARQHSGSRAPLHEPHRARPTFRRRGHARRPRVRLPRGFRYPTVIPFLWTAPFLPTRRAVHSRSSSWRRRTRA